jgi:HD-like signal output (HDOD) protein
MRVLFVDDESQVLRGIERTLHGIDDLSVDACFAASGEHALNLMQDTTFDVVVSDVLMPGMDGEALLGHVERLHPDVIRVVLTEHAAQDVSEGLHKQAHQLLSKPCTPEMLADMLRRVSSMRRLTSNRGFVAATKRLETLPPAPNLWLELNRVLGARDAHTDEIVEIIERDPALCAKMLQLANSAWFGSARSHADTKLAVTRLGVRSVRVLVLAAGAFSPKTFPPETLRALHIDLDALQEAALRTAVLAQQLCLVPEEKETAFTAGLLSEVGSLVMAAKELARADLYAPAMSSRQRADAERAFYGFSHAEAGAYLLGLWGLPGNVVDVVAAHHEPGTEMQRALGASAAVFIASHIVDGETPFLEQVPWCRPYEAQIRASDKEATPRGDAT